MSDRMHALTIWQPWAWAVAYAGKDVENRTWKPPSWAIGRRIAIHAGKRVDDADAYKFICDRLGVDALHPDATSVRGAVVCVATLYGTTDRQISVWFGGPVGWILTNVTPLPRPVPCRGAQGLWALQPAAVAAVLEQIDG